MDLLIWSFEDVEALSDRNNIFPEGFIFNEVQDYEINVQIFKPSLVEFDQAWNNVASDVPIAVGPDLRSYGKIASKPRSTTSGLSSNERRNLQQRIEHKPLSHLLYASRAPSKMDWSDLLIFPKHLFHIS